MRDYKPRLLPCPTENYRPGRGEPTRPKHLHMAATFSLRFRLIAEIPVSELACLHLQQIIHEKVFQQTNVFISCFDKYDDGEIFVAGWR